MFVYGVSFDKYESEYITKGTRTDDARDLKFEVSTNISTGIDEFNLGPYKIRECVTHYDPSTKKHTILAYRGHTRTGNYNALLANPDNNVMIEFPKFYYQRPERYTFKVSNTCHENYLVSPMHENNDYVYITKYKVNSQFKSVTNSQPLTRTKLVDFKEGLAQEGMNVINYSIISSLTLLMLVKYANLDIQDVIGIGIHDTNEIPNNGATNSIKTIDGRSSIDSNASSSVLTLGIENWYGNVFTFVDDIYKDEHNYIWIYGKKTNISTISNCGYISELVYDTEYPFLLYPSQVTTHFEKSIKDYAYSNQHSKGLVLMNGSWKGSDRSGIFSFDMMSRSTFSDKHVGAFAYFGSENVEGIRKSS